MAPNESSYGERIERGSVGRASAFPEATGAGAATEKLQTKVSDSQVSRNECNLQESHRTSCLDKPRLWNPTSPRPAPRPTAAILRPKPVLAACAYGDAGATLESARSGEIFAARNAGRNVRVHGRTAGPNTIRARDILGIRLLVVMMEGMESYSWLIWLSLDEHQQGSGRMRGGRELILEETK